MKWLLMFLSFSVQAEILLPFYDNSEGLPADEGFVENGEVLCIALTVYHEARGEPRLGREQVAWTIINRAMDKQHPATPCEVVWQIGQFSWTRDSVDNNPDPDSYEWQDALEIADMVMAHRLSRPTVDLFRNSRSVYFMNPETSKPANVEWMRSNSFIGSLGKHEFYEGVEQ